MVIGRAGILREDLKKIYKKYYSLKDKEINFYEIPEMNYLITSGIGIHSIYEMYDFKEIWTMGRFINRVKHYTIKEISKNLAECL